MIVIFCLLIKKHNTSPHVCQDAEMVTKGELMKTKKLSEELVRSLLRVFPAWNSKLVRPFRESLNKEMSLETYYCLETVRKYESTTMTELAQQLKVPKQQVTKLIDKLCEHQFVERVHDEKDRRSVRICLTPQAVEYLDEYYLKNTGFIQKLEEKLSEEELQRLNEAMKVLEEILPGLD